MNITPLCSVVKFGGSSLANADNILKAKAIIQECPKRSFIVVSAPGKCMGFPRKITDLLIDTYAQMCFKDECDSCDLVFDRFKKIADDLKVDITDVLERTREEVFINKCEYDFIISRGEYLMAVLMARLLGYKFLDAANFVVIKKDGTADIESTRRNFSKLDKSGHYVMGGFFGKGTDGNIKTFARGGSDYSGAIAAVCIDADLYENFTDTYGVQTAHPSMVKNTKTVHEIDYSTLHTLCRGGASVIYPNCIPLLKSHSMPLQVDCTLDSGKKYTYVTHKKSQNPFFSITYETRQNINKDTAEILCVMHKIKFTLSRLRELLFDHEVYLVEFSDNVLRLLSPVTELQKVVNLLHSELLSHI